MGRYIDVSSRLPEKMRFTVCKSVKPRQGRSVPVLPEVLVIFDTGTTGASMSTSATAAV